MHTSGGKKKQFPLVWVAMSRRRAADYVLVMEALKELLAHYSLPCNVQAFMADFELGEFGDSIAFFLLRLNLHNINIHILKKN